MCEGSGARPPPRERVSRAAAEGRRAECVCEAESELESVSGGASSMHIGFGWPVAVLRTLPFSSVAMRLGPVLAGPVHSCVGAAGRFAAVCCVRGGVLRRINL